MTTTCSDLVTRALALNVANQGLLDTANATDVQTALVRINQAQARAFTRFTKRNKTGYLTSTTVASTTGNGNREIDMSFSAFGATVPRIQRILKVSLANGTEVALVDPNVQTSELAPRYYNRGESLVEVSNDWDTQSTGSVTLTVLVSTRPADLDTSTAGLLTQAISVPDRYADVLTYDLGAYLAEKDVGRDPTEAAAMYEKRDEWLDAWIESAVLFGGVPVYTFDVPAPKATSKD